MNITQMRCGESAEVRSVDCSGELKDRLYSLNIRPKARIRLVKISLMKKTFLLQAGSSSIALRREVARCVQVNP